MKAAKGEKFVDPFKKLTVKEIEKRLEAMSLQERENYLSVLLNDPRKSVKAIGMRMKKKQEQFLKEKQRIAQLCYYEIAGGVMSGYRNRKQTRPRVCVSSGYFSSDMDEGINVILKLTPKRIIV